MDLLKKNEFIVYFKLTPQKERSERGVGVEIKEVEVACHDIG